MQPSFVKKYALAFLFFAVGFIGSAQASTLFSFTESGAGVSASGFLTTDEDFNGSYTIRNDGAQW